MNDQEQTIIRFFTQCPNIILYGLPHIAIQDKWVLLSLVGICWNRSKGNAMLKELEGPYKLSLREIEALTGVQHSILRKTAGKNPREGVLDRLQSLGYITLLEGRPINETTKKVGKSQTYLYIRIEKLWRDNLAFSEDWHIPSNRLVDANTFIVIQDSPAHYTDRDVPLADNGVHKMDNGVHQSVHQTDSSVHKTDNTVRKMDNSVHQADNTVRNTDNSVHQADNTVRNTDNSVHPEDNTVRNTDNDVHQADNTVHHTDNSVHQANNTVRNTDNSVHQADNTVHHTDNNVHQADNNGRIVNHIVHNTSTNTGLIHNHTEQTSQDESNTHSNHQQQTKSPHPATQSQQSPVSKGQAGHDRSRKASAARDITLTPQGRHMLDLYDEFKGRKAIRNEATLLAANRLGEVVGSDEDFLAVLKAIVNDPFLKHKRVRTDLDFVYRKYDGFLDIVEQARGKQPPGASGDKTDYNAVAGMTDEQRTAYRRAQQEKLKQAQPYGVDRQALMDMRPEERVVVLRRMRERQGGLAALSASPA